jgi:hypothetical protein
MCHPLQRLARPIAFAITLFICLASTASMAEGLSGPARTAFVDSAMRGCLNKASENKNAPAALVSQSCSCFAEGLADRTSNDELLSLAKLAPDTRNATMQPRIDALRRSCLGGLTTQ